MVTIKPKIGTSLDEQETVINVFPKQINEKAYVYTTTGPMLNRMLKLYEKYPDEVSVVSDNKYGTEFVVPRDWIKVKPKKQISKEQGIKLAERLRKENNIPSEIDDK